VKSILLLGQYSICCFIVPAPTLVIDTARVEKTKQHVAAILTLKKWQQKFDWEHLRLTEVGIWRLLLPH